MFVNLEKVEIKLIKKEFNLNCYPIKKDTTFITKGGPPLTKSIKQKNTKLILDFYSKEMLLPGLVRKSSIWEIVVREEDFPLNEETKEIVEKLTEIINTVESMEFPTHRGIRPKNFILEQTLSNNEVKRTKIKKFSGKWVRVNMYNSRVYIFFQKNSFIIFFIFNLFFNYMGFKKN